VKAGWETAELGDVIVTSGSVDPTKSPTMTFKYVDVSSVSNETFEIENAQELLGKEAPSRARRRIKSDDVLFATIRPTLKRIALVPPHLDDQVCSTGFFVFRTKPFLLSKFLFYFLLTESFLGAMEKLQSGASYPAVNDSQVRSHQIHFPPIEEQRRIVGVLDEAFAGLETLRANAEKNLQNAWAVFQSELDTQFAQPRKGWVAKKIGQIARTQYGLSVPMNETRNGFGIFRMGDVQDRSLVDTGKMKYADITNEEFQKYKLKRGDVLFNRTNSYELVGKTGLFSLDGDYCFASYLIRVLADRTILNPVLLNYMMNSTIFQESVKSKSARSVNQANVNATILSNELVRFPVSLAAQDEILAKFASRTNPTPRRRLPTQARRSGRTEKIPAT
jgi:type I restriction enzyme, S subunit